MPRPTNPAAEKLPLDHIPAHALAHIPFIDQAPATTDLLVTFEDLPLIPGDFACDVIPSDYAGFVWSEWSQIYDAQKLREGSPVPSGYISADASGPKVLIAEDLADPVISSPDGSEFDFQSAYFTSAWKDAATLTVTGYRDGVQVAVQSFTIGTSDSTFVQFASDFDSVDQLGFDSEGGTVNGYGTGNGFLIDDLLFKVLVDDPLLL